MKRFTRIPAADEDFIEDEPFRQFKAIHRDGVIRAGEEIPNAQIILDPSDAIAEPHEHGVPRTYRADKIDPEVLRGMFRAAGFERIEKLHTFWTERKKFMIKVLVWQAFVYALAIWKGGELIAALF